MTVYVVQRPKRRGVDGKFREIFDLKPAEEFGDLQDLLASQDTPLQNSDYLIDKLHLALTKYNGSSDYILCIGNPILIGWAIAVAAGISPGSSISCLQWNGTKRIYLPVTASIY